MAERRPPAFRIQLEYRSDRLQPDKLRQAYQLLVPERRAELQKARKYARVSAETAEGAGDHHQPNGGTVGTCGEPGLDRPQRVAVLDDGYSGANLVRPGLDGLRDRIAEGQIDTVLVLSPDRLSRKYAYQILLTEEFHRHGAEIVFIKSPPATTPEEQLLAQVKGMIAEYERAQIIERTRHGKRHRARARFGETCCQAPLTGMGERQRMVRLLVKEVVVGPEAITIRHCLPMATDPSPATSAPSGPAEGGPSHPSSLLRSGSHQPAAGKPVHEPVSEVLADAREGTAVASPDCRLCG